jgi:hypothetical protein
MSGFYKSQGDTIGRDFRLNNDVTVSVRFQKPWRFPNAAEPKDALGRSREQSSYGLFIQTGENEFIIAGINLAVTAKSSNTSKEIWLKDAWEGTYENRIWKPIVLAMKQDSYAVVIRNTELVHTMLIRQNLQYFISR